MDCDQVFNVLTRGPFPTGDPIDRLVEQHLDECDECWQFAEALRPALDLFQESVPPAEGRELPGYWAGTRSSSDVFAELTAEVTHTATARPQVRRAVHGHASHFEPSTVSAFRDVLTVIGFVSILAICSFGLASLMQWIW